MTALPFFLAPGRNTWRSIKRSQGPIISPRAGLRKGNRPSEFIKYCQRYDKETAEWAIKEELKNYTRIALVDIGVGLLEAHREHAQENARFLHLRYEEIRGSLEFFEKMLKGLWDKDFIILKPGEEVTQELFLTL
jgi:hypothetical protein